MGLSASNVNTPICGICFNDYDELFIVKASLAAKHALKPEAHTEPSIQVLTLEVPPLGKRVPSSTRPTLVYSSKKATITKPVQESELATSYEGFQFSPLFGFRETSHNIVCIEKDRKMNKDKIFKLAKGFRGRAKNCIRIARERVEKALQYSYRDRRTKKRDMRSLWIERINAGSRLHGVNYNNFIHGLMKENIQLNRKVLSELSMHEPYTFKALVDISQNAFPGNKKAVLPPRKEGISVVL
ncbi:hypothetical protein VitviT2T_004261 [Vitis vinifera]|uniref:Large ribosomal subunit protein bL20c n=2 Tax=Vitis vinifera TaxID=29760 RepID=A0ABY9BPP9_VITVI|nr:hypothetical protein VitviT2T_004261 [Vitis vinifera]